MFFIARGAFRLTLALALNPRPPADHDVLYISPPTADAFLTSLTYYSSFVSAPRHVFIAWCIAGLAALSALIGRVTMGILGWGGRGGGGEWLFDGGSLCASSARTPAKALSHSCLSPSTWSDVWSFSHSLPTVLFSALIVHHLTSINPAYSIIPSYASLPNDDVGGLAYLSAHDNVRSVLRELALEHALSAVALTGVLALQVRRTMPLG